MIADPTPGDVALDGRRSGDSFWQAFVTLESGGAGACYALCFSGAGSEVFEATVANCTAAHLCALRVRRSQGE